MLVTCICFRVNEACKKNAVVIHNELAPGSILDIRCFDRTTVRTFQLKAGAPPFIIYFKDTFPQRTYWECTFRHGPNLKYYFHRLETYAQGFVKRCGQFRAWTARPDGIWFKRRYHSELGHVLNWKTIGDNTPDGGYKLHQ